MKKKKYLSCFLTMVLIILLPTKLFAENYNIDEGDITITSDDTGQYVSQTGTTNIDNQKDDNPVITQNNPETATNHKITVSTEGDNVASFTIDDINIAPSNGDGIDVGTSKAEITLKDNNTINVSNSNADSAIHVSSGSLTITSDETETGKGTLIANTSGSGAADATIGSHENETMSGTIHITGNADIDVDGVNGTAIGSGENGELSGNIVVDGNANVDAETTGCGAAIGSGTSSIDEVAVLSGSITIGGNATVNATTSDDGAGIGTGYHSSLTSTGSITIKDNANVDAETTGHGAAIGGGRESSMNGNITIGGNATVNATGNNSGAAIGTGYENSLNGSLVIEGNANVVAESNYYGAAIGTGNDGNLETSGKILIRDNANVIAFSNDKGSGIGTGVTGNLRGTIEITDKAKVVAVGNSMGSGIGSGLYGVIEDSGQIIISENANVTAYGNSDSNGGAAAIGSSCLGNVEGTITISSNSNVKAITGTNAAAIGTGKLTNDTDTYIGEMSGTINILDYATVTTETKTNDKVVFDKTNKTITYTSSTEKGIIGEGNKANHTSERGEFKIGTGVTINGYKGNDIENLKDYINYYKSEDGIIANLIIEESKPKDNTENKTTSTDVVVEEQVETIVHKKVVNTSVKDKPVVENISDIEPIETNNMNIWSLPLFIVLFACLILLRRKRLN